VGFTRSFTGRYTQNITGTARDTTGTSTGPSARRVAKRRLLLGSHCSVELEVSLLGLHWELHSGLRCSEALVRHWISQSGLTRTGTRPALGDALNTRYSATSLHSVMGSGLKWMESELHWVGTG
jgi:hypothetical protein